MSVEYLSNECTGEAQIQLLHDYFLWKGLCWISVEFHCYFPLFIKYCHILFIIIVFWLGCDSPSELLFFRARFASFHTHASLLVFFVCFFILFHSCCSHARVFGKTLVHEFPVIISIFYKILPYFVYYYCILVRM